MSIFKTSWISWFVTAYTYDENISDIKICQDVYTLSKLLWEHQTQRLETVFMMWSWEVDAQWERMDEKQTIPNAELNS